MMLVRAVAFLGLGMTGWMGVAQAAPDVTKVQLRTDESVPLCTFDRSVSTPRRTGLMTIAGEFAIQCQPYANPYRVATQLSPFAQLAGPGGQGYAVKWYLRHGGLACEGDQVHPDAVALHSGSRATALVGDATKRAWSYCVQLHPLNNAVLMPSEWPLQGQLDLDLRDAQAPSTLPEDALRFHVNFAHNSSVLSEASLQLIDALVNTLQNPWDYHVQLHAHASQVGDAAYNHDLTLMRLKRVRDYLVSAHNIRAKDTWGQAWGDTRPMALNTPEDEDTQNRRVDIVWIPKRAARLSH